MINLRIRLFSLGALLLFASTIQAFALKIERADPTFWWVGMKNPNLQIMFYGKNIGGSDFSMEKYRGVKVKSISQVENPNYFFVNLEISAKTKPGNLKFHFDNQVFEYTLNARTQNQTSGIDNKDFIYLLLPDRFSNGDPTNDKFADMADPDSDRNNPWLRHGGDLQGVSNHLDYFNDLGVTALWLNPVIENNQPQTNEGGNMRSAYHGYGFTDHYKVDRRLGGNEAYLEFIQAAHKKGLKVIQDAVYNHVGINHYFIKDLPMKSWLNQWETYTNTSYKEQPVLDPHASEYDRLVTTDGWFMPFLPDLNQRNEYVANYLIQHAIWTVEYFGIDSYRIDTYMYNDMDFMNRCNAALVNEFPKIFLFGESLANPLPNQAAFVRNNMNIGFACNLESTVDHQFFNSVKSSLNEPYGWSDGVNKLYLTLVQDYLYQKPERLVTYLDNHDEDRIFSVIGEDKRKFKTALVWLMTQRGIPQIYYGTEILMKNFKNPSDAEVRRDFPGGWAEDNVNKFNAEGRIAEENEIFDFVKKLAEIRKTSSAVGEGKMIQFQPFNNGIYAYFRESASEIVMVISNISNETKEVETNRFAEIFKNSKTGSDLMNGNQLIELNSIKLDAYETKIIRIK